MVAIYGDHHTYCKINVVPRAGLQPFSYKPAYPSLLILTRFDTARDEEETKEDCDNVFFFLFFSDQTCKYADF